MEWEELWQDLQKLMVLDGVSGFEGPVVSHLKETLAPLADDLQVDPMGNLFVWRRGDPGLRTIMVAAHTDEIGAIVKSVEDSGFIRFEKVGGTSDPLLLGRTVRVNGKVGVIGARAGHYLSEKDRREVRPSSELYVDVGASSAAAVQAMGIRIGGPIAYLSPPVMIPGPGGSPLVSGKALDDRLGCAILLSVFRRLQGRKLKVNLVGAFTVQEEVGLRGAGVAANRVKPDLALVLDTMPAGDTPDMSFYKDLPVAIGRGPAIQVFSNSSRGSGGHLLPPGVKRLLTRVAEDKGIPYQLAAFNGGTTDAASIHLSGSGVPAGTIAIPRRYSHSPVEMGSLADALGARAMVEAVLTEADPNLAGLDFLG